MLAEPCPSVPANMRTLAAAAVCLVQLFALLLLTALAPDCGSVCGFCYLIQDKTRANGSETDWLGEKALKGYASWYSNDLQGEQKRVCNL